MRYAVTVFKSGLSEPTPQEAEQIFVEALKQEKQESWSAAITGYYARTSRIGELYGYSVPRGLDSSTKKESLKVANELVQSAGDSWKLVECQNQYHVCITFFRKEIESELQNQLSSVRELVSKISVKTTVTFTDVELRQWFIPGYFARPDVWLAVGCKVNNASVEGPALVSQGSVLSEDSHVGPYAVVVESRIGRRWVVENSIIQNSELADHSE